MKTRGPVLLTALAAVAMLASGCFTTRLSKRGTTVPYKEIEARRGDLRVLAREALEGGKVGEAFYVVEFEKSRSFASLAGGVGADLPPVFRDLGASIVATRGAGAGGTRGLVQVKAKNTAAFEKVQIRNDAIFWTRQQAIAKRIEAVGKRQMSYRLAIGDGLLITTIEEIQRSLAGDQLVLSYLVDGETVTAFCVTRGAARRAVLAAPTAAIEAQIGQLHHAIRRGRGPAWHVPARHLYTMLLGPFERELQAAAAVTLIPDGLLFNVPFAVLQDGHGKVLVERARVSYLPSGSFYRAMMQRPLFAEPPRMLAIGNAAYPEPWAALPKAEAEARAVARVFDNATILVGAEATEERFRDAYRNYNILHFATHGQLAGRLAASASSLLLTRTPGADGFLSAAEIARLDLSRTYLAVLSACETSVDASGGSLGSISAAFLAAGTPTVIGSLWQVSDDATAALMLRFYERFLDLGSAAALRAAQLGLRKMPGRAHPFFWGAFALYGWDK